MAKTVTYKASPTLSKFHKSDKLVRAVMGPFGSGKSVGCCWELFKKACTQLPADDTIRYTRFAVIRNTYRELIDTTCKTWFDWFPEHLGRFIKQDMTHHIRFPLEDGTTVDTEILFRALDKPNDIKKLLSLELTGAWVNECREVPKAILDALVGRIGRYPSLRIQEPTWAGIILDTNPPDEDHWFYKLFEEQLPENHVLFRQPSGRGPDAENIPNLPKNYYANMIPGKDPEWIKVYVDGNYGFIQDGKPVYPEFKDHIHVSKEILYPYSPDNEIIVGLDFGRTPAAVFMQETPTGQWQSIDELVTEDMGADKFAKELNTLIKRKYQNHPVRLWGDPKGQDKSSVNDDTPYLVLSNNQIIAHPTHTNDPIIRRDAVVRNLLRLTFAGEPGLIISPNLINLRKGMNGGFRYKRVMVTSDERYQDKPDKNKYSHVCEAQEYALLGEGEDERVIGGFPPTADKFDYDHGVI